MVKFYLENNLLISIVNQTTQLLTLLALLIIGLRVVELARLFH
jgi:hypothetical protein